MDWVDLPEVALIRVLNCLSVHDQLNARLVCRHWKQITDSTVRRNELVLFLEIYPRPVYWFHDGSEVDLANAFLVTDIAAMKGEFFMRYFRRVRRLMIVHPVEESSNRFIEQIQTSFLQLEHLQFSALGSNNCRVLHKNLLPKIHLDLSNLRTFYSQAYGMPRRFHCPKLTELFVYSRLTIKENSNKETKSCIQNLRLLLVCQLNYPRGFEFLNLEILYFNQPSLSLFLSDFPRLKEIHYFNDFPFFHPELIDHLENLLEQKRSLKRDKLSIYFAGFKLDKKEDFNNLDAYLPPDEPLQALDLNEKILRLIQESPSFCKFNLHSKEIRINDSLDDELIHLAENDDLVGSMFKSVTQINFGQRLSKESLNFFDLSDRFRYVSSACLYVELSQVLLDRLPAAFPHLVDFYYKPAFFTNQILNFKFLASFKSLHSFNVHHRLISMEEVRSIFEKAKFIDWVYFERPNRAQIRGRRLPGCNVFATNWRSTDLFFLQQLGLPSNNCWTIWKKVNGLRRTISWAKKKKSQSLYFFNLQTKVADFFC